MIGDDKIIDIKCCNTFERKYIDQGVRYVYSVYKERGIILPYELYFVK